MKCRDDQSSELLFCTVSVSLLYFTIYARLLITRMLTVYPHQADIVKPRVERAHPSPKPPSRSLVSGHRALVALAKNPDVETTAGHVVAPQISSHRCAPM